MADLNRFAVSLLSRSNKDAAIQEEVLMHKGMGQVLVKTTDGNVISYDKLSRTRNHIDFVSILAENLFMTGEMYTLELDGIDLPEIVNENVNLLHPAPIEVKSSNLKRLMVSIDLDCIEIVGIESVPTQYEPKVRLDIVMRKMLATPVDYPFSINLPVSELNRKIIDPTAYLPSVPDLNTCKAYISGITITRHPSNAGKDLRNILHNIIVIVD